MNKELNLEISENQINLLNEWNNTHKCKNIQGGKIVNLHNPIGPVVLIKCDYCNESLNITEYKNW